MAVQNIKNRRYEDARPLRSPASLLMALGLFGLALILEYIALISPTPGTLMGNIRDVMRGLGGDLSFALPLTLGYAGVLCLFSAKGRRVSIVKAIIDLVMVLCIFAGFHVFFAERIIVERMTIMGFANFVSKSYRAAQGGGAVGALLCWPMYRYLGVAGGFIAALLSVFLCLTATGRVTQWVSALSARTEERAARAPRGTPTRPPLKRRPIRPGESRRRPASMDPMNERTRGVEPRRRPEGSAPRRRPRPPQSEQTPPVRRRKKLYVENIEKPQTVHPAEAEARRGRSGDVGFNAADFDDFDMLDAEAILQDKMEAEEARAFKPDRSQAVEISIKEKKRAAENMEPVEEEKRIVDIPDEELRIEPQAYETPDEDVPFEIPSRQRIKKGEALPVINHEDMKVMVEEDDPVYNYPPIDLLTPGESEDVTSHARRDKEKAQLLQDTLLSFGITAKLTGIAHGPAVTRFELQPAPGIKVSRITSLSDDIALNLAAMSVRIEAPIPGKAAVGVEIPNDKVEMVRLRDVLESPEATNHKSRIAVGLGKDNSGRYIVADIAKMPHVLIAGQTGSGKSVCINAIIASILFRASPEEVRLILIDPKVVELSIYNNIPHLVCPVVTDPKKAASALDWAVAEMTRRYKLFAEKGVRDIKGYNKALEEGEKPLPQMVIIIDELADLMMVSPGEVEDSICRIAQLARACGMHLVIATQRPSVNVITGIIKANIPTRIAFSVASQVDSRTMIDHGGAEKLLGNGDMLFVPNGMKSMRVQGAWVSDEEVHAIVEYIKQDGEAVYDPDMLEHLENAGKSDAEKEEADDEYDPKLPEAVEIVMDLGQASISMLQRKMRIGYARAGRLIDIMARRGIVSEADGSKPRTVLITREEARMMFEEDQSA